MRGGGRGGGFGGRGGPGGRGGGRGGYGGGSWGGGAGGENHGRVEVCLGYLFNTSIVFAYYILSLATLISGLVQ